MNIGLFTSVYFNNIGNGFIDLGAEQVIKEAMQAEDESNHLIKISQCANFAASLGKSFSIKENRLVNWVWVRLMQKYDSKLHDYSYKTVSTYDIFSPVRMFRFDYLIIPGCVLTVPFFTIYGKLLEQKVAEGCRLVFLGASGNYYNDSEVKAVSEYLVRLHPFAIITRDEDAFKFYQNFCDYAYNGIDNVFFVNRLDIPEMEADIKPYCVVNLEEPKHADLKKKIVMDLKKEGKQVIFTDHKPYPYTKISSKVKSGDTIISDYPLDYLIIYKNADTVYSDRVHACIPTLSFGNKAVLYSDSPRISLFENVDFEMLDEKTMKIGKGLEELQIKQINFLKSILNA